jgi:Ala-tRNA(Pro) deacylase
MRNAHRATRLSLQELEATMIPAAISDYLEQNHARYSLLPHPIAYTAQEEAAAAHVPGREWAKTVVCFADDQPILAVVPAPFAVDLIRLQHTAHARSVRLAKENELASLYRDCELGAMPPLGPLYGQPVFVDRRLTLDPEVSFSAGSHHDAIRMPYQEFERLVKPTVAEIALGPSLSSAPQTAMPIDPVCGTPLDRDSAAGRSEHHGATYYFCSQRCKMEFDDNPYAYVPKNEGL